MQKDVIELRGAASHPAQAQTAVLGVGPSRSQSSAPVASGRRVGHRGEQTQRELCLFEDGDVPGVGRAGGGDAMSIELPRSAPVIRRGY